jgi:hypothetical protein
MKRYRKKPVVVEAVRLDEDNRNEVAQWSGGVLTTLEACDAHLNIYIKTLEGIMTAIPGDWIIKGVNGEFYPCRDDIFRKTYEEVD